jgi:hypothetical protein
MTPREPRELTAFARATGYDAAPCPGSAGAARDPGSPRCTNCGGSGRLWTSARGSLSDDGLARLRHLIDGCG